MAPKRIGIAITGSSSAATVERIEQAEEQGIPAAWLTSGGGARDSLTLLAAAAVRTKRILLGTSIVQIWSRHPLALAQQAQAIAELAPGRFRLGIGTGHKDGMERTYGADFQAPLGHLRKYIGILKAFLQKGEVDFDGRHYRAHARTGAPVDVPVMASALRRGGRWCNFVGVPGTLPGRDSPPGYAGGCPAVRPPRAAAHRPCAGVPP